MYWLGLDVGTGGSRALLIDTAGLPAIRSSRRMRRCACCRPCGPSKRPKTGGAPANWRLRGVLREAGIDGSAVRGVGLTGQMHGLVLLDEQRKVIRPALIGAISAVSRKWISSIRSSASALCCAIPRIPFSPASRYQNCCGCGTTNRRSSSAVRTVLLPKDYLRFKLSGDFATDVSDASGTALFDVANRQWSEGMVERAGLERSILPNVYESSSITGRIHGPAAAATGLALGTPVIAGAGDQAASAVGNGIVHGGRCLLHHWYVRRGVRVSRKAGLRSGRARTHVLPRGSRSLARHGSHAGRGPQSAVVSQPLRAGIPLTTI